MGRGAGGAGGGTRGGRRAAGGYVPKGTLGRNWGGYVPYMSITHTIGALAGPPYEWQLSHVEQKFGSRREAESYARRLWSHPTRVEVERWHEGGYIDTGRLPVSPWE